ncbi:hypothetical protein AQ490_22120 [Wenjunlia vitaminophila]|uniref:non-specific serine/threonine protein kinase n=1 Tax=Wenjunlia vitaminophila TaxID=76728 RepID=A0A0T6LSN6_WENVI|nr:serine/threonine-protein kinase [Wenjunlia vitaminophila]KRV49012.1 hypothetical protein AQ490_22120 [Wenjunlia vitaminophila]
MDRESEYIRARDVVGDRYELTALIGKGGMAEVWRADDRMVEREVAVKFLRPDTEDLRQLDTEDRLTELDALRGRFRREGRLLGTIRHPGIPELYGQGTHRGSPYLAMRLVEGVTLYEFLRQRQPLTLRVAAAVAVQIAEALACVHALPVVHRDLKPQNMMLSWEGSAALIDFGIAKPLGAGVTAYTRHGSTLGSRGYQAPEQILEREPTPYADIYSFGCVCYELFAGCPPFPASGDRGPIEQHLRDEPMPLCVHAGWIPGELDDLVLRMLAKEPQDRPDIGEVLSIVRCHAPSEGDPAPSPRLHPDPTLPFRAPDRARVNHDLTPDSSPGEMEAEWLDTAHVEEACAAAQKELDRGESGAAVRHLAGLAPRVRAEWGVRRPLVREVWWLAAEGLRRAGDYGGAAPLYTCLAEDMAKGEEAGQRAERAVLRLRAAECRLVLGQLNGASAALAEVVRTIETLPEEHARAVGRVREEVANELDRRRLDPPGQEPRTADG